MRDGELLTFYQFMMTYRGNKISNDQDRLAEWMFNDHDFPKFSTDYNELSDYLEWTSPFMNAITIFDQLWEVYLIKRLYV